MCTSYTWLNDITRLYRNLYTVSSCHVTSHTQLAVPSVFCMHPITFCVTALYLQDTVVVRGDFPKALTGITHLFNAKPAHRLVIPEERVFREEVVDSHKPSTKDIDLSNPVPVAQEFGMTERQRMAEQKRILKEAEETKKKEDRARKAEEKRREESQQQGQGGGQVPLKHVIHDPPLIAPLHPQQHAQVEDQHQSATNQHHPGPMGGHEPHGTQQPPPQQYSASVGTSNPYNLGVGSAVQMATTNPNDPPHYGVIRWIGTVSGVEGLVAGIKLVSTDASSIIITVALF